MSEKERKRDTHINEPRVDHDDADADAVKHLNSTTISSWLKLESKFIINVSKATTKRRRCLRDRKTSLVACLTNYLTTQTPFNGTSTKMIKTNRSIAPLFISLIGDLNRHHLKSPVGITFCSARYIQIAFWRINGAVSTI